MKYLFYILIAVFIILPSSIYADATSKSSHFQEKITVRLQMVLDKLNQKLREGFSVHI